MAIGGDLVHYNYGAMHAISEQIGARGMMASGLLDAAVANESQMMAHFQGAASTTAAACLSTYKQAQTDIIEIINRGKVNYATATDSMAAAEQAQSAAFPG